MSDRGIYCVAYGDPARRCAERLIASVHRYMPGIPVAVASDSPLAAADVSIVHADLDLGGRAVKTLMWDLAPKEWQYVLYLDADTELVADVSFLFDTLVAGWELTITKDIDDYDIIYHLWRRDSEELKLGRAAIKSDYALQLAGGVVAFRRTPAIKRFLHRWHSEWKVLARRDQGALIRAIYACPVQVLVLGNEWNSFTGLFKGETAGVIHHRGGPARRLSVWKEGRLDDRARWRRAVSAAQPPRIHIVCPETNRDRIVNRLAHTLTEGTGWTIGRQDDPNADINYAFPYLAHARTPMAGWFSHREDTVPNKVALWKQRAEAAVLRVTSALMYEEELAAYGPTVRILPPLDRAKFCPVSAHTARTRPVLGVAGYTYAGGRKGEALLAEALQRPVSKRVDWQACGSGWPIPSRRQVSYAQLHEFYQELDLYVCTSLIEGVPYPPLEALACGVPVVIPRDVGLLDELPTVLGIVRYRAGDVDDLCRAIEEAIDMPVDRAALRDATEPFTLEGWVEGHREVLSTLEVPRVAYGSKRVRRNRGGHWVMEWEVPP